MKALVVDDDQLARATAVRMLRAEGVSEVLEARDGKEGLSVIERQPPDLLLLDLDTPVMGGVEVMATLRGDPRTKDLPVVILTASKERSTVEGLITLGITDYLVKPVNGTAAARRLSQILTAILRRRMRPSTEPPIPPAERPPLLLVDPDTGFRRVARLALEDRFEVVEALTGIDGFRSFLDIRAPVVCLGEGLTLLDERRLAKKLREHRGLLGPRIFLCTTRAGVDDEEAKLYTGIIPKGEDPDAFRDEFDRVVGHGGPSRANAVAR